MTRKRMIAAITAMRIRTTANIRSHQRRGHPLPPPLPIVFVFEAIVRTKSLSRSNPSLFAMTALRPTFVRPPPNAAPPPHDDLSPVFTTYVLIVTASGPRAANVAVQKEAASIDVTATLAAFV